MAIKQIKYREKLRLITESDIMSSLHQFKKLTQSDLQLFQEGAKHILRIIAPGFDVTFADVTLTSTSKVFIDLYQHFGFVQRGEQLYNELLHNSKQQIFLCLIQHLIDLTKIAMQTAIKRFLDMRLFCVGKEIEKAPTQILQRRQLDYQSDNYSPIKKVRIKNVQRSESNQFTQILKKQEELKLIIDYKDFHKTRHHQQLSEIPTTCEKITDSPTKSTRIFEEIRESNKEPPQTQRETQNFRNYSYNKYTEQQQSQQQQQTKLPSIHQNKPYPINLMKSLKQRNFSISLTIQNYLKSVQDSSLFRKSEQF